MYNRSVARTFGTERSGTDAGPAPAGSRGQMKMPDQTLRMSFNAVAALYAEMRPGYPQELIEDVVTLSGIPDKGKILEIGCGTGQATRSFAARGYEMVCLDIGSDLIDVARERLGGCKNVTFVVCSFEEWDPDRCFNLVISATAFRWVDAQLRYTKSAEVLVDTGALAVFSNRHVRKDEGFFAEVQELYRVHVPEWHEAPHGNTSAATVITEPGRERFREPIERRYPWSKRYTADQYIRLLSTYSDHITLPGGKREKLFDGVRGLINRDYRGRILKHYEAVLDLWKKKD